MKLWELIIDHLQEAYPSSLTFQELVRECEKSEEMVQRTLNELIEKGFPIDIKENKVNLSFPLLSKKRISEHLSTKELAQNLLIFDSIGSTNTYAKEHLSSIPHGSVFLAHEQVQGKGRLGRGWSSPVGKNISMTLILKPSRLLPDASLLTQLTAAAIVEALAEKVNAQIKWPNDILLNKKKVAGILTEAEFSNGKLDGIVIGMGVNTNLENDDLTDELKEKATSIRKECGEAIDPNLLLQAFFESFEKYYQDFMYTNNPSPFLDVCRKHSALIGREMWLIDADTKKKVLIQTIDSSGGLVVQDLKTKKQETLTSTRYSIRGENSYV